MSALVMAACGSSGSTKASNSGTSSGATGSTGTPKPGGTLAVGIEQEPDCVDWLGSCSGSTYGFWIANPETIPHVYYTTPQNTYQLSPLMAKDPVLSVGPPMTVTYSINPQAKWSDGQPITSADFQYTWDQIVHGQNIYSTVGYSQISQIQTPNPTTAVAVFSKPFADWKDLFGADQFGVMPSHILQGQDRDAAMKNGYSWSGGPWIIQSWVKGQSMTLVPNPNYWAQKPYISKVVYQFVTDTSAEAQDYKTGQFMMIDPQPQPTLADTVKNLPGSTFKVYPSLNYEGLWFNVQKPPLNDVKVRQALAYATDRQTIVSQLFGSIDPSLQPLQSSIAPSNTAYAVTPYTKYSVNMNQVNQLMTSDGWAKGADGIWAKAGQEATVQIKSTSGNQRRALMEQILQSQWKAAGFNLTIQNETSGTLFGEDLPAGNFQAGIYAQTPTSPDPGQCVIWCSANIPGPANQNSGENWDRLSDPSLDNTWGPADTELNTTTRTQEVKAGQTALANLVPFIPIDPLPIVLVWSNKLHGPIAQNPTLGAFWNMNQWWIGS
ncbi:MAG TPA: peptide ABC transporter substrate-binding protein [Acidimicrobiales bacterium]|nr:peptide ABC transporter substrate-binding protein [Acidimicrobiales bacterium]